MSSVFTRWWTTYSSVDEHTNRTINWLWETALASFCYGMQFSSVQDGTYALGKAHMRSNPSFRSPPNTAFETVNSVTEYSWTVHNKNEAPQQYKAKHVQTNPKNESAETSKRPDKHEWKNSDPIPPLPSSSMRRRKRRTSMTDGKTNCFQKGVSLSQTENKLFPKRCTSMTDGKTNRFPRPMLAGPCTATEIRSMLLYALLTLCQACCFQKTLFVHWPWPVMFFFLFLFCFVLLFWALLCPSQPSLTLVIIISRAWRGKGFPFRIHELINPYHT